MTTGAWRARTVLRDAVLFLAPVVLAAPFILDAVARQGDVGAFKFVAGWASALPDGPAAVAFFYLTNLGHPVRPGLVAAFTARGLGSRWFLLAWLVALFLVPNVVRVSAVEFDMNKYFQIMWIAVAILAAWVIRRWPTTAHRGGPRRLGALAGAHRGLARALGRPSRSSPAQEAAGALDRGEHTGRSVFVTDAFINSPVDLAGRLRIIDVRAVCLEPRLRPGAARGGHDGDLLRRPGGRGRADGEYGATYVLSSGGVPMRRRSRHRLLVEPALPDGLRRGRVTVWRLRRS